jgi:hypothetical protein
VFFSSVPDKVHCFNVSLLPIAFGEIADSTYDWPEIGEQANWLTTQNSLRIQGG